MPKPATLQEARYGYNRCDNCNYFKGGVCKMFNDAPVKSNYVCNQWESRG
jgi:hypothetical protein